MSLPARTTFYCRPESSTGSLDDLVTLALALKTQLLALSAATGCTEIAVPLSGTSPEEKARTAQLHAILRLTGISVSLRRGDPFDFHVFRVDPDDPQECALDASESPSG